MVKISYSKDNYGIYSVKILDHAGDSRVCAAVSCMGMTLIGMLNNCGVKFNKCVYGSGNIDIDIAPFVDDDANQRIQTVIETIIFGLKQLQNSYKDEITITEIL